GILHMKRSAHERILEELGLSGDQTIYLDHYGHIGQFDPVLSLELGLRENKIREGDLVVLVSAGIGYAWGATVLRWGEEEKQRGDLSVRPIRIGTVELSNGEKLGYRMREGGERPLVLIHGNMTSSVHWDVVLERIDGRFRVYAV